MYGIRIVGDEVRLGMGVARMDMMKGPESAGGECR